jgi:hypothetical protein
MLYREIIAVCSEIHTKHINTLCGQNVELLTVKLVVHMVTTGPTVPHFIFSMCGDVPCSFDAAVLLHQIRRSCHPCVIYRPHQLLRVGG